MESVYVSSVFSETGKCLREKASYASARLWARSRFSVALRNESGAREKLLAAWTSHLKPEWIEIQSYRFRIQPVEYTTIPEVNSPTRKFYRGKWITFNSPSLRSCRNCAKSTASRGRFFSWMKLTRMSLTRSLSDSRNSLCTMGEVCINYRQWKSIKPTWETNPLGMIVNPQSKLGYDPKVMPSSLPSHTNISPLSYHGRVIVPWAPWKFQDSLHHWRCRYPYWAKRPGTR